jgi:hypothetical protein
MRKLLPAISMIGFLFCCNLAQANNACLLEGKGTMMGIKLDIKDCIQNAGLPEANFKAQCEGISQATVAMGGPAAKITYLASCPVPFQAKCDNTKTAKTIFFYYKRAADEAASLQSGCELMKGTYTKGTF